MQKSEVNPMRNTLYIIVPCYNEEACVEECASQLLKKMEDLQSKDLCSRGSRILFVNDGSADHTPELLEQLCQKDERLAYLSLSANCGHQNALLAGMLYAKEYADCVITIDADLQQDMNAMEDFLQEYAKGKDIVYGVRRSRDTDGLMKKLTAGAFYKLMHWFGADVIPNHADYRLLSRRVLAALDECTEVNLFLRGLIRTCGFHSCVVEFDVSPRFAGESKYSPAKMLKLAVDGITSFTTRPLRLIMLLGLLCVLVCLGFAVYDVVVFLQGKTVPGWTSIMLSLWLIAGMLLMSLGCVGEYVGRIYMETKRRPRYFIMDARHQPAKEEKTSEE